MGFLRARQVVSERDGQSKAPKYGCQQQYGDRARLRPGTKSQKDKCSDGGEPDTPVGKARGQVRYLQVMYAANKVRRAG